MKAKRSKRMDSTQQLIIVLWLVATNMVYYRQLVEPVASYLRRLISEGL